MRPTSAPENTSYSLSRQMDRKPGVRRRRLGSLAKKACLACRSLKVGRHLSILPILLTLYRRDAMELTIRRVSGAPKLAGLVSLRLSTMTRKRSQRLLLSIRAILPIKCCTSIPSVTPLIHRWTAEALLLSPHRRSRSLPIYRWNPHLAPGHQHYRSCTVLLLVPSLNVMRLIFDAYNARKTMVYVLCLIPITWLLATLLPSCQVTMNCVTCAFFS